jgi:hypothetical protein
MTNLNHDNGEEGNRRKEEGMHLAADAQDHHDEEWAREALADIRAVALDQPFLDAEDVRAYGVPEPKHSNAWGSVWRSAINKGWIIETQEEPRRNSKRPEAHGAKMTRYKSRIWKAD